MELYNPSVIRAIKKKYGFQFSKSLGQNFLISRDVVEGIVSAAGIGPDDLVIEIGPGIGVLTSEAADAAGKVVCIELDRNLIEVLSDTLAGRENITVVEGNVLKTDLTRLIEEEKGDLTGVKIIGNLPYYITTGIIMKLLEERVPAESITIMMQKEVAERVAADPGSRIYGALSVAVQYYCTVHHALEVPKENFMPQPKVDSTVLRLDLRKQPAVDVMDENMFFQCVKAGFGQRRKTLSNSLKATGFSAERITDALTAAGVDPKRRAETLSLEDFANIANALSVK